MLSKAEKLSQPKKQAHIAVFGSAFNPPTLGHKSVIDRLMHFDKVLLLPSIAHAWGKEMLDFSVRCELVKLFIADIGCDKLELCSIEETLYLSEKQYLSEKRHLPEKSVTTYDVLSRLEDVYPDDQITFIIGPDNFAHFTHFYKHDEILKKWSLLVCPETVPIRSTQLRENLKKSAAIDDMTTPSVERFLRHNTLFPAD